VHFRNEKWIGSKGSKATESVQSVLKEPVDVDNGRPEQLMVTWRLNLVDLVVGLPRHRPMVEGCEAARRRQTAK
jgi:hypothetical protein